MTDDSQSPMQFENRLEAVMEEARSLARPGHRQAGSYRDAAERLLESVNAELAAERDISELIGGSALELMYQNHRHHVDFMTSVFLLGDFELLARTVPWVYRVYVQRGFSTRYFPRELEAWKRAVKHIVTPPAPEIVGVYEWLIERHDDWVTLSYQEDLAPAGDEPSAVSRAAFLAALLAGDTEAAWSLAAELTAEPSRVGPFYLEVVQPALYEVGRLWERGEVSIATEHMASSVVSRIMAALAVPGSSPPLDKGIIFVSAAENELHELGAWMVSDLLHLDGWSVRYFGANTPEFALLEELRRQRPGFLALSVTMPFNLVRAQALIESIRADPSIESTRILVGGQAFHGSADAWRLVAADATATDAAAAVEIARNWWAEVGEGNG